MAICHHHRSSLEAGSPRQRHEKQIDLVGGRIAVLEDVRHAFVIPQILTLLLLLPAAHALAHGPTQPAHQLYRIGDIKLESGEVIKDFAISYVTHGTLNARKSNTP